MELLKHVFFKEIETYLGILLDYDKFEAVMKELKNEKSLASMVPQLSSKRRC
jgi:hypothetical protein